MLFHDPLEFPTSVSLKVAGRLAGLGLDRVVDMSFGKPLLGT
jgi:hypothetical protein